MNKLLQIVVADDHPVLLEGVVSVIQHNFKDAIIHKAANGAIALQKILEIKPAIAILDIEMPFLDGIEVAKKIRAASLDVKLVFLTLHKERSFFKEIQNLNVDGYLLKEFSIAEITTCIEKVLRGEKYFSSEIEDFLVSNSQEIIGFTKTERAVIKLIADGKTSKEIAEMLFVSDKTIQSHRYNICKKLDLPLEKNSLLKWVLQNISKIK